MQVSLQSMYGQGRRQLTIEAELLRASFLVIAWVGRGWTVGTIRPPDSVIAWVGRASSVGTTGLSVALERHVVGVD